MKTWAKVLMMCWLVALWMQLQTVSGTTVNSSSAPEATTYTSAPEATTASVPETTSITSAPESTTASVPEATNSTSAPEATTASVPETTSITSAPEATTASVPETTSITSAPEATTASVPETTSITSAPEATTASVPETTSITSAPEATTASVPEATNSTSAPEATTASVPETTNITSAPTAESSTPDASTAPPATTRPDPCISNLCPENSRCEPRFESFACVCFSGLVLEDGACKIARVFPGDLRINKTFTSGMSDKTSKEFKEISEEIVAELQNLLKTKTSGYVTSTVLSLRQGSIIADVENIYNLSSSTTAENVTEALKTAAECNDCFFAGATLTDTDICNADACDPTSTICSHSNGALSCQCKEGYVKTPFTFRTCTLCPSGTKAENDKCTECSFGYSGINCKESYLLAVVVVACVLGGLLLILLIVLIVMCCRKSKKGSSVVKSPYIDMDFTKRSQVPKIPRATANKGWEPANLELVESGSTRALVMSDHQGNGMKNLNTSAIAYRTHGQVNPYYQHNEGH